MSINVPHDFIPRQYQKALYNAPANGIKRGVAVWHRRAGKDKVFVAMLAKAAIQRRGIYFYILPYYKQARKIIWEGLDGRGKRYLDVIPQDIIKKVNNQEMIIELINGSLLYFLGSDNIDSIVGTNPIGLFFSEYSLHKPQVWDFLRPILIENGGFAFFNGTPRGRNHLHTMFQAAQQDPEWFCEQLSIEDTNVMTPEQVEAEIKNGMARATARQEFYCSFDAALVGAYYEEPMNTASTNGQHASFPVDPYLEVHTAWDLGISDTMVIVLAQQLGQEIRIIDCIVGENKGLDYYVKQLRDRPYVYGTAYLPHDVRVRELSNGKSRLQALYTLGLKNIVVNPHASLEDGIAATRRMLYRTYIHDGRCGRLIEALKTYRASYDEVKQVYDKPIHDWSSHYADAVRQLAMGLRDATSRVNTPSMALGAGYDPTDPFDERPSRPTVLERVSASQEQLYPAAGWDPRQHTISDAYYAG